MSLSRIEQFLTSVDLPSTNYDQSKLSGLFVFIYLYIFMGCYYMLESHAWIQRGAGGTAPSENHKNIGFLSNTGLAPLQNLKTTKPVFNVGPSLVRQQNAIQMA